MYEPSRYLLWARRYYGRVPFELASSGMPTVPRELLGMPASLENPHGWDELRAAIAASNDVPLDESVAALGTSHAIWLAYAATIKPGDDVLVEAPSYEPMWLTPKALGANVNRFERRAKDGYALDPKAIAAAMTKKTKVVAISNLHNPTGVRVPDDVLAEVAELCAKRKALFLVDEVYAPFDELVDAGGVFYGSARKLSQNVIAIASLTKCFGLGPERVGWVLGPPDVIERAQNAVTLSLGLTPLSHANLAVHAFSRIGYLADRARDVLRGKREIVEAWVKARPDLEWSAPEAGLFALVTTKRKGNLTKTIEAGIENHGVIVAAGEFFGVPNGLRVSWSLPEDRLLEALEHLDAALPVASAKPSSTVKKAAPVKAAPKKTAKRKAPKTRT